MKKLNDEEITFHNKDLQIIRENSKDFLKNLLKKLDEISSDIKLLERVLKNSGFREFAKTYSTKSKKEITIKWFSKGLFLNNRKMIECKANDRVESHAFLPDFYKCINKENEE